MSYGWRNVYLAMAVVAATVPAVWGQTTTPAQESQIGAGSSAAGGAKTEPTLEETIDQVKHPFKGFTWGADQRIRQEYLNNHYTLNQQLHGHEYDYGRYRTRLWASGHRRSSRGRYQDAGGVIARGSCSRSGFVEVPGQVSFSPCLRPAR